MTSSSFLAENYDVIFTEEVLAKTTDLVKKWSTDENQKSQCLSLISKVDFLTSPLFEKLLTSLEETYQGENFEPIFEAMVQLANRTTGESGAHLKLTNWCAEKISQSDLGKVKHAEHLLDYISAVARSCDQADRNIPEELLGNSDKSSSELDSKPGY